MIDHWEHCQDMVALAALERRLRAEMTRVLELHPALANPVPPVPIERVNGTFRMKVAEVWQELVDRWRAGEYTLPFAESLDGLVGPIRSTGCCLEPIRCGIGMDWFDPAAQARDGDFVLVQWHPPVLQAMVERCRHKPEWIASYGEQPGPLATKLLKLFANQWWLLTNSSALPLGRNRILGVLAHVQRPAIRLGEAIVDIDRIADEAVTTIASIEDDSVSLPNPGIILSLAITPQNLSYTMVVTASLNVWISANPGAGNSEFFIVVLGNAVNLGESQRVRISSTAAPGERIALQIEVPITPSDEINLAAFVQWVRDSGTTTGEARSISIRAESIKR